MNVTHRVPAWLRGLGAIAWIVAWTLAPSSNLITKLRRAAAAALDFRFAETSPVPLLSAERLAVVYSHDICLPFQSSLGPGNQTPMGLVFLSSLAKALHAGVMFEIGTYNGLTALTLALNQPDSIVHTLDLPPHTMPSLPINPDDLGNIQQFAKLAYEGRAEAARIVQHIGDSANFNFSALQNKCDLVYIDGAHSYEYLTSDSNAAILMVSKRGVVVWDDYWRRIPSVARYLASRTDLALYRVPNTRLVVWFSQGAIDELFAPSGRNND